MTFRRGDVVLVNFPNSDLLTFKQRPALIVQDVTIDTGLPQVIIALITSTLGRTGPTRVRVDAQTSAGKTMRLQSDSVIVTDNLATIPLQAIVKTLGRCALMQKVDAALAITLGLSSRYAPPNGGCADDNRVG